MYPGHYERREEGRSHFARESQISLYQRGDPSRATVTLPWSAISLSLISQSLSLSLSLLGGMTNMHVKPTAGHRQSRLPLCRSPGSQNYLKIM